MNRLIAFFVEKDLFTWILTFLLCGAGYFALKETRREMFPNVQFDVIRVQLPFPGASPGEVERLLVNPIEQDLSEVDGIKKIQSTSVENLGGITITLDPEQTTEDEAKDDVQDIIDQFKPELPNGAEEPIVDSLETKQAPVIELSIGSEGDPLALRKIAKKIEKEIERIPEVAKVVSNGLRDVEIRVEVKIKKLNQYRMSLDEIIQALKTQNVSIPGGLIEADSSNSNSREKIIRTISDFNSIEDVKKTVIRSNDLGVPIRLSDVANVFTELEKASVLTRTNGVESVNLTILKKEKGDAISLVENVKSLLPELKEKYTQGIELNLINDTSVYITRRLNVLTSNLAFGLVFVLLILCVFLPFRVSFLVSFGIPFAFLGAILVFNFFGFSVNLISMIGLIIVVGMLVDDAIVVMDNVYAKIEEGHHPKRAAILGTQEIWPAVLASVLTTVCVFIPTLMMNGIFGKFVRQVPLGVIIPLIFSLLEVFFVMPAHAASLISVKSAKKAAYKKENGFWAKKVQPFYMKLLALSLRFRYLIFGGVFILLGLVLFVTMINPSTKIGFKLFPPEGIEQFFIRTEAQVGTSLNETGKRLKAVEKIVQNLSDKELKNYSSLVGMHMQDPNDPGQKRGSHLAQISVFLTPEADRDRSADEIIADFEKMMQENPVDLEVKVDRVNPGPPVGKAIDIGIRGDSYDVLLPVVQEVKAFLAEDPLVMNIDDSHVSGKEELQISVNSAEARAASLSPLAVGNTVRAAFEGVVATTIKKLDEEIDIRVSLPQKSRGNVDSLSTLKIANNRGNLISLGRVASVKKAEGFSLYEHQAGQRQIRVSADLDEKCSETDKNCTNAKQYIPELEKKLKEKFKAQPVSFYFGGEAEDTNESFASLLRAFIYAIALIFLILVFLFQNLFQPFLVVMAIPLGVISALLAFYFHSLPLSFLGTLGLIALAGVIVNNAIVFVDFVNQKREDDQSLTKTETILDAGRKRLRPIVLTTLTTACGLLPTAYGIGGMDRFIQPIVLALGWGLVFGSFLTLIVIPAGIAITDDLRTLSSRIIKKIFKRV